MEHKKQRINGFQVYIYIMYMAIYMKIAFFFFVGAVF